LSKGRGRGKRGNKGKKGGLGRASTASEMSVNMLWTKRYNTKSRKDGEMVANIWGPEKERKIRSQ